MEPTHRQPAQTADHGKIRVALAVSVVIVCVLLIVSLWVIKDAGMPGFIAFIVGEEIPSIARGAR